MLTEQQHLASADRPLLAYPTGWPARRDYRCAQRMAQKLGFEDCQAVFLDRTPRSAARYRWGLFYPLACLPLIAAILFIFLFTSAANISWVLNVLLLLFLILAPYTAGALVLLPFQRAILHCEQIHLYANGFVTIDPRGRRQGARWDQLSAFRRGSHEGNQPSGRVRWNSIRATIAHPRLGQRSALTIIPQLPDSTEICARIERAYTAFWLPRFREQFAAGHTLDFDALLLHCDGLGKTTPGNRRFSASLPRKVTPSHKKISVNPGMARGLITQAGADTAIEWLRRSDVKSIRINERFILIRTIEPVRRDKQGRADRLWFQLDTLGLKDAAILKELLPAFPLDLRER